METQRFIVRRFSSLSDSWNPHDGDFDSVVAKAVDKVRDGKAGDGGLEVIEVQIVRRVRVQAVVKQIDVTDAAEQVSA